MLSKILKRSTKENTAKSAENNNLVFASTSDLEAAINTEDDFRRFYYSMYHSSPDTVSEFTKYREKVREEFPEMAVPVGRYFVLFGEAAYMAVSTYYNALSKQGKPENFRLYAEKRALEIEQLHSNSQNLAVPVELSEGQLAEDKNLEFYSLLALSNRQIFPKSNVC